MGKSNEGITHEKQTNSTWVYICFPQILNISSYTIISVSVQLFWFQQVLMIASHDQHVTAVCVASIKYWVSIAMISILVQWSEVLTG